MDKLSKKDYIAFEVCDRFNNGFVSARLLKKLIVYEMRTYMLCNIIKDTPNINLLQLLPHRATSVQLRSC